LKYNCNFAAHAALSNNHDCHSTATDYEKMIHDEPPEHQPYQYGVFMVTLCRCCIVATKVAELLTETGNWREE
jgi:hypothetical protein